MPIEYPLEELFRMYCNSPDDVMHKEGEKHDSILLSQMDAWFAKANLLKEHFTTTDTGLLYVKFNSKWRLNFEEFFDFLDEICKKKGLDIEKIKKDLSIAGPPD